MTEDLTFSLWLEFEHWVEDDASDPYDDIFNMSITLADGTRYALNVWTYLAFERIRAVVASAGENLGGLYLEPPDLFIERLDRGVCERVVADLIARDGLRDEWRVGDDDEEWE